MPSPRFCTVWKISQHCCNGAEFLGTQAPLVSCLAQGNRRFLYNTLAAKKLSALSKRTHRRALWEQAVWSEERGAFGHSQAFAFYSSSFSGTRQECQAPAGGLKTMENPADGNQVDSAQEVLLREVEQALGSPLGTGPEAPAQKPLVMVISGPSGVGKDAVINRLQEVQNGIHFVVTATTRAKRPGEIDGKDYFFLSKQQFESMIQNNELLEYAIVYGDFKGIPKRQVRDCLAKGFDVVLRVDVQGAATVRSILGSSAVFIFLVAESEAALVKRLVERKTETKDKLLLRIATAREELKRMEEFDYVVVNADGQLEKTVSLISHIIDAEKARVHQREAHL